MDAIGNRLRISRPGFKPETDSDFLGVRFMSYDPYARLTQVVDSVTAALDNFDLVESYQYDNAGTQSLQYIKEWNAGTGTLHDATNSYPSIDDKLSVVNRHIGVKRTPSRRRAASRPPPVMKRTVPRMVAGGLVIRGAPPSSSFPNLPADYGADRAPPP